MTTASTDDEVRQRHFDTFAADAGRRLRSALVARYGVDVGVEATADALGYAWEHWDELRDMSNPCGYLYRVAQNSVRRYRRWGAIGDLPREHSSPDRDAVLDLSDALARLKEGQRSVVLLVHAYGWSYEEVAEVLGISHGAVRNQLHRGMRRLRRELEVDHGN